MKKVIKYWNSDLNEIREIIKKEIKELKLRRKEIFLEIHENQMRYPLEMIRNLYSEDREIKKKIIDLEVKEVEEIISWIEEEDYERDSDGYLHFKYSQKLRYLKNVQEDLSE